MHAGAIERLEVASLCDAGCHLVPLTARADDVSACASHSPTLALPAPPLARILVDHLEHGAVFEDLDPGLRRLRHQRHLGVFVRVDKALEPRADRRAPSIRQHTSQFEQAGRSLWPASPSIATRIGHGLDEAAPPTSA
jgi:hypothetical protein